MHLLRKWATFNVKGIKRKRRLLTQVLPPVIILLPVATGRWQINCIQTGTFLRASRHLTDITVGSEFSLSPYRQQSASEIAWGGGVVFLFVFSASSCPEPDLNPETQRVRAVPRCAGWCSSLLIFTTFAQQLRAGSREFCLGFFVVVWFVCFGGEGFVWVFVVFNRFRQII